MWRAWIPPAAYAALIFYLSSLRDLAPPVDLNHADKVAHVLEYGGLGFLLFRAGWLTWRPRSRAVVPLFTVGLGALVAMGDELFQGTVGRNRSLWDWTADVVGLVLASVLAARLTSGRGRPDPRTAVSTPAQVSPDPERTP